MFVCNLLRLPLNWPSKLSQHCSLHQCNSNLFQSFFISRVIQKMTLNGIKYSMWQRSRTRTRCRCQCHVYLLFEYRNVIGGRGYCSACRKSNDIFEANVHVLYSVPAALCTVQELLRWLFRNHSFISFLLYLAGLMAFVSSLVKKYYLRQFLLVCSDPLIAASMPAGLRSALP